MPLLDHFHPPLHPVHNWEAVHSRWASAIADALNEDLLPPEYFAEPETRGRGRVEIDVATFEQPQPGKQSPSRSKDRFRDQMCQLSLRSSESYPG